MVTWIDLVNFNADASCLSTERWLAALDGGERSEFFRWLSLYADSRSKVVLGLTGASIADVATHNPDALQLIRANPEVFEGIYRPFSHDIALIRSAVRFSENLKLGLRAAEDAFSRISRSYLPPEFMLSNEQVSILADSGCDRVFVNASRLASDMRTRIPALPYVVRGVAGRRLGCLPVSGALTAEYLEALHTFDASGWRRSIEEIEADVVISWRDGESPFLLPDGLEREAIWLANTAELTRSFLSDFSPSYVDSSMLEPDQLRSYPVHSFLAWMREFRMIGYLGRVQRVEIEHDRFDVEQMVLWLQSINSDVLSAVEKRSPQVDLVSTPGGVDVHPFTLFRSERGFEGEECLGLLEKHLGGDREPLKRYLASDEPLARKLGGRLRYLRGLGI